MSVRVKSPLLLKYSLLNLFLILLVVLITSVAAGTMIIRSTRAFFAENSIRDTMVLTGYFGDTLADALKLEDDVLLLATFDKVKAMPNIGYAVLYDKERKVRHHSQISASGGLSTEDLPELASLFTRNGSTITPPFDPKDVKSSYVISRAFLDRKGEPYGMLLVKFTTGRLAQLLDTMLKRLVLVFVAVGGGAVGLGLVFAIWQARATVRPIRELTEGTEIVGAGDLRHELQVTTNDEIGLLAGNFNTMTRRLKGILDHLEELVAKRTKELNDTLVEVSALKEQQDGDYFLTTLIVKPLMRNVASSPNVKVEFFVRQKKHFLFRKKESELGGDMCIAANVRLAGRACTVVINGDAMGKSIQGAGGALVLGVAFNSIISQTQAGLLDTLDPEAWLRLCYDELQKVYLPFEGSMYISATILAIDDATGRMWYLNAEHPWTVLYRDGKAGFLESELEIHKFGMELNPPAHEVNVRSLDLREGDVIVTGSDGRDDLAMGMRENGQRHINEDETLFLRHVEGAEARLDGVVARIVAAGELTDDLSIVRVAWVPPASVVPSPPSA